MLKTSGAHWLSEPERLLMRRPDVCVVMPCWDLSGLLFLRLKRLGQRVWECTVAALQIGQSTWIDLPPKWRWRGM